MSYDARDWMMEMRAGDFDGDEINMEHQRYIKNQLNAKFGIGGTSMNGWMNGVFHDILSCCYKISNVGQPECAITKVIFNDPATIVFWSDGTKTVVKRIFEDTFDKEKGLAMAISKKAMGNKGNYYEVFKKWIPELEPNMEVEKND